MPAEGSREGRYQNQGDFEVEFKREIEYPRFMSWELVEKWGDGIPAYADADPENPEWRKTPHIPLEIPGLGFVFVKNEADRASNPTGTIKDRAAWELATLYRDYARALYLKVRNGSKTKEDVEKDEIPRVSVVTAGNEGRAIAEGFRPYDLPPPKVILGTDADPEVIKSLLKLRADVYQVDLSKRLDTADILRLTNNEGGIDITSAQYIEPHAVFYDWHVHEAFNDSPTEIYVPYGSGRVMENYLYWQQRTLRNDAEGRRDPRLAVDVAKVISTSILGSEPKQHPSIADKLSAPFKPFLIFRDQDIAAAGKLGFTGENTGKHLVDEGLIREAYDILASRGIEAEPSAAAGLALYIERFRKGLVKPDAKVLVINTGKGLENGKLAA